MYSIVMLMAMSGAPEMPAFGGRGGCNGCLGGGWSCNGGGRGGFLGGRGGCRGGWGRGCCGNDWNNGCCGAVASSCGCCGAVASSCGCCGGVAMGGSSGTFVVSASPATVVVVLPADAKLAFDGIVTNSTSNTRRFTTPALNSGVDSTYTLTAEIVRDGKTLKATQVIAVRGGQTTEVNLNDAQFTTSVVKN